MIKVMEPWPDTTGELRRIYGEYAVTYGPRRVIAEMAIAYGLTYGATQKRLVGAGVHEGIKRRHRAPGSGVCACGALAVSGRYKGRGEALCNRCYMRTYAADPESSFRRSGREYIAELKRDAVCADCGGKFPPCCMHFDHVPERGPKLFNLGNGDYSAEAIDAEVAKCDIVCANCHAIRTWMTREKHWIGERRLPGENYAQVSA